MTQYGIRIKCRETEPCACCGHAGQPSVVVAGSSGAGDCNQDGTYDCVSWDADENDCCTWKWTTNTPDYRWCELKYCADEQEWEVTLGNQDNPNVTYEGFDSGNLRCVGGTIEGTIEVYGTDYHCPFETAKVRFGGLQ